MNKKKKRKIHKKNKVDKLKQFGKWFVQNNKFLFLVFVMMVSILFVVKGTLAWTVASDSRENIFGDGRFKVNLEEQFIPSFEWEPGTTIKKNVYAHNLGDYPSFVRMSVEEMMLKFKVDVEGKGTEQGTGNVYYEKAKPTDVTIDKNKVKTWIKDEYYLKEKKKVIEGNKVIEMDVYYKGDETVPKNLIANKGVGLNYYDNTASEKRKDTDLNYMVIVMPNLKNEHPTMTEKYWLYGDDGYFYYSEKLMPGDETSLLMSDVSMEQTIPNRLKDSLYKVNIKMDAEHNTTRTLTEWNHDFPGDKIYDMLKSKTNE